MSEARAVWLTRGFAYSGAAVLLVAMAALALGSAFEIDEAVSIAVLLMVWPAKSMVMLAYIQWSRARAAAIEERAEAERLAGEG